MGQQRCQCWNSWQKRHTAYKYGTRISKPSRWFRRTTRSTMGESGDDTTENSDLSRLSTQTWRQLNSWVPPRCPLQRLNKNQDQPSGAVLTVASQRRSTALYNWFLSKFLKDPLTIQTIAYMDPIPSSPTNNDVVRETMVRTVSVATKTSQEYAVLTYDLAIALKAYSIKALESPIFYK